MTPTKADVAANSPGLVIFDCDGVLVDSEPTTMTVLSEMVSDLGVELSPKDALERFRGRQIAECLEEVERDFGIQLCADFTPRFREACNERFRRELTAPPHLKTLLDTLPEDVCVASNAPIAKIETTLTAAGLMPYFRDRIFSAYELLTWKPEPDLFLHAANAFGVPPERAIVIEDSLVGLRAAKAAGMPAIQMVPDGCHPVSETAIHCFSELGDHLAEWRCRPAFTATVN